MVKEGCTEQIGRIKTLFKIPKGKQQAYYIQAAQNLKDAVEDIQEYHELNHRIYDTDVTHLSLINSYPVDLCPSYTRIFTLIAKVTNTRLIWKNRILPGTIEVIRTLIIVGDNHDIQFSERLIIYCVETIEKCNDSAVRAHKKKRRAWRKGKRLGLKTAPPLKTREFSSKNWKNIYETIRESLAILLDLTQHSKNMELVEKYIISNLKIRYRIKPGPKGLASSDHKHLINAFAKPGHFEDNKLIN